MQPNDKRNVSVLAKRSVDMLDQSLQLTVTRETLPEVTQTLNTVKQISKELNAKKRAITDPLNKALKEVRILFRDPERNLAEAEQTIKAAILAYHEAEQARADKEIQSIENRVGAGKGHYKIETAMAKLSNIDQPETNIHAVNGSAQIKQGPLKVRITDAMLLIQDHPTLLNSPRVLEALRLEISNELKMGARLPAGAEVYHETIVAGIAD